MNLLHLVLYQSCNQKCPHCPMKQWTYEPDETFENGKKKNALNNEALLKWLDKYLDPNEWLIQITGGEPGLYPEIDTLIQALTAKGYKGIILTNGSLPIPESANLKRIAAWHKSVPSIPKYFDSILILKDNPDDDWQGKITHCQNNNIPYDVFRYQFYGDNCDNVPFKEIDPLYPLKYIENVTTVYASGTMAGCPSAQVVDGKFLFDMSEPEIYPVMKNCFMCQTIRAFEHFCEKFGYLGSDDQGWKLRFV